MYKQTKDIYKNKKFDKCCQELSTSTVKLEKKK